ncbi:MAG: N-acetyl-gamma-glutamyl-phosphate reductase [Spirochaeta sp.]|jgi:N-acetyl-gamma-glutamyl-phosphate reductase|nr:N-acetyl-gamma-glutamyl-phosphate reductase [Spirochaeta sp.]
MKATILGSNGYGGMLLLRVLAEHPEIELVVASSRSQAGQPVREADPGVPAAALRSGRIFPTVLAPEDALSRDTDVVFSALPHGASAAVCEPILGTVPVIDLSADFRFEREDRYTAAYGTPWPQHEHQNDAVYGLTEWYRRAVTAAQIIANPGCYPTATLLPLLPLVEADLVTGPVVVNALSGITGAGRTPKVNTLYGERTENANAYAPGTLHRHQVEISERLGCAVARRAPSAAAAPGATGTDRYPLLFIPHLVPIKQGMAATTVVTVSDTGRAIETIRNRYVDEPFVELTGTRPPETREVRGTNRIRIGWREEADTLILMSVIDNLWKGASGQAVQNMNARFGFEETAGLTGFGDL